MSDWVPIQFENIANEGGEVLAHIQRSERESTNDGREKHSKDRVKV